VISAIARSDAKELLGDQPVILWRGSCDNEAIRDDDDAGMTHFGR
jgi:hypothetical protein